MKHYLEFERPVADLEGKIQELVSIAARDNRPGGPLDDDIARLEARIEERLKKIYAELTPWHKTLVARHPERPHFRDYINKLIEDFTPLGGDRLYGDDPAIVGGLGRFRGRSVMVIGHEKGADTEERVKRHFGMAFPEGYRKAIRLIGLANHFALPVLALVDTPGAYPGVEAEERGQAEAIARSIEACLSLTTPNVALIIGEGGSGGAVALATANRVVMMEHAIYSVASPEAAASILWRDSAMAETAAEALHITASELKALGVIDAIAPEPIGGAHRAPGKAIAAAGRAIARAFRELEDWEGVDLRRQRMEKFMAMGRDGLAGLMEDGEQPSSAMPDDLIIPAPKASAKKAKKKTKSD